MQHVWQYMHVQPAVGYPLTLYTDSTLTRLIQVFSKSNSWQRAVCDKGYVTQQRYTWAIL